MSLRNQDNTELRTKLLEILIKSQEHDFSPNQIKDIFHLCHSCNRFSSDMDYCEECYNEIMMTEGDKKSD